MGSRGVLRRQRGAAAGAGRRAGMKDVFDRQLLHRPVSRGAGALHSRPLLGRLLGRTWFAPALLLRWLLRFFVPAMSQLLCTRGWPGLVGQITMILAFPRRAAARGTGTVVRILIKALVGGLEIRQQLHRQGQQLRLRQLRQIAFVDLGEIETR
jgi:hypothetical protein